MARPTLQQFFLKSFAKIPAGYVAEPFEIFLVILAMSDSLTLLLHYFQGTDQTLLPYYHGALGLFIWAGVLATASVILIWALSTLENHNLLAVRKLEITGLWLYAAAFSYYVYGNISVGLENAAQPIVFPILSAIVISVLVCACVVRAISLASPITALSVTRVNRVKQIQGQLKETLNEASTTLKETSATLQQVSTTLQEASGTKQSD